MLTLVPQGQSGSQRCFQWLQVKTLKAYHRAMQDFWTQGQQLDRLHEERRTVLQHMLT